MNVSNEGVNSLAQEEALFVSTYVRIIRKADIVEDTEKTEFVHC